MSTQNHAEMVEDIKEGFSEKLEAGDEAGCSTMIEGLREAGYESEAKYLEKMWTKHLEVQEAAIEPVDLRDEADKRGY